MMWPRKLLLPCWWSSFVCEATFSLESQIASTPHHLVTKRCEIILFDEDRPSDSPFVERVWRCLSLGTTPFLSIAASCCELVVSRLGGKVTVTVRGPETRATPVGDCPGDADAVFIQDYAL
jgi:hypothetical protein